MATVTGFEGSSVIVTGGGSGIGLSTVLQFAQAGARVVVADIDATRADEAVRQVGDLGGAAVAVAGDLGEQSVVDRVVATAVDAFGGVDVLVNNAGIMDEMDGPQETSDAVWERVIRINLTAPFLLTRAVLPLMLAKGKGAIVNTASEAGLRGSAAGTAYTVSKHGVIGLTKSTAIHMRDKGIRVNAVAPGGVATNIEVHIDPEHAGIAALGPYMVGIGRVADPSELASVIVFLASDAASNVNGVILPVDNGWSAV